MTIFMIERPFTRLCLVCLLALMQAATALAGELSRSEDLFDLPLEQLKDISVVSASRKTQSLAEIASAVFVINQEDIRRSGATTIPELLRMVPGVQVATIDGTTWAVSARGFNGTFANKLLVMIDGRTIYTPLNGGVFWDAQDLLFENIERIEVIRGPGSTMWGANAVNGVINILTKSPEDTQGVLVTGLVGTRERGTWGASYGSAIGDSTSCRLYLKHVDRDGIPTSSPFSSDGLSITRGGFRFEGSPAPDATLTVQGDVYQGAAQHTVTLALPVPPFTATTTLVNELFGANLLSRLDWLQSPSSKLSLQLYYDRTDRGTPFVSEGRDTFDLDLHHSLRIGSSHELTWGTGYRFLHDRTPGSSSFSLTPASRSDHLVSLFAQDEITLVPERLRFILGSKVEYIEYSGWQFEPSAKLSWTPREGFGAWASVARAVRTPTRGEQDVTIRFATIPGTGPSLPTVLTLQGSRGVNPESVLAFEAGVRAEPAAGLSLDLAAFYNQYQDLIGTRTGLPTVSDGSLVVPSVFINLNGYETCGAELALQWQLREWWRIKGGYAYLRVFGTDAEHSLAAKGTPEHQATLRSLFAVGRDIDVDLWARYVGANRYPSASSFGSVRVPAYVSADLRLAWRVLSGVELSLVGQNLLASRLHEGVSDQSPVQHQVGRTVYGKVAWAF